MAGRPPHNSCPRNTLKMHSCFFSRVRTTMPYDSEHSSVTNPTIAYSKVTPQTGIQASVHRTQACPTLGSPCVQHAYECLSQHFISSSVVIHLKQFLHTYLHHVCAVPTEAGRGHQLPGTNVADGFDPTCGC